jgi:hypothetical protein
LLKYQTYLRISAAAAAAAAAAIVGLKNRIKFHCVGKVVEQLVAFTV